jgi:hypothetical protein
LKSDDRIALAVGDDPQAALSHEVPRAGILQPIAHLLRQKAEHDRNSTPDAEDGPELLQVKLIACDTRESAPDYYFRLQPFSV